MFFFRQNFQQNRFELFNWSSRTRDSPSFMYRFKNLLIHGIGSQMTSELFSQYFFTIFYTKKFVYDQIP